MADADSSDTDIADCSINLKIALVGDAMQKNSRASNRAASEADGRMNGNRRQSAVIASAPPLATLGLGICLFAVLLMISRHNELLFHSLAELFSTAVAWSVFLLVFSARRFVANDALVLLGTAYLSVGLIDLLHTLAYSGTGIFSAPDGTNLATQLWMAARYLETSGLLAFSVLWGRTARLAVGVALYAAATLAVLAAIFVWGVFPDCYLPGSGLTPFKIGSEYLICVLLAVSLGFLFRKRASIPSQVFSPMVAAILLTIVAELFFTFYISAYGISNRVGHMAKILSCFLVYQALIRSGLTQPYDVLFKAFQKAQADFHQVVDAAPISIMEFDADGVVTYVNPFHLRTFGAGKHAAEYFLGRKIHELPGIVKAGISQQVARVLSGVSVTLADVHFPRFTGGHSGYQSIRAVPFMQAGRVTGGLLLREDVSQLRHHEHRFARALATTLDGFWLVDKAGNILETNKAAAEMLGYPPDGLKGKHIQDVEATEDKARVRRHVEKIMRLGHDRFESRHRHRDGSLVDVAVSVSFLADPEATFVVFTQDISEQKRAEAKLIMSEAKFAAAFHHNPMPMSITNLDDGTYIDLNEAFVRATGFSKQDCIGRTTTEIGFISGEARQKLTTLLRKYRRLEREELDLVRKDGSRMVWEYWGEIISYDNQLRLISIAHDISARKRDEREREASENLLRLINQQNNLKQLVQETAGMLRHWSGCQAVGILLKRKSGVLHRTALGFADDGALLEDLPHTDAALRPHPRSRVFLTGMQARVLSGDSERSCFTDGGSFWTNNVSALTLPVDPPTAGAEEHVGTHSYESIAIVPLRFGNAVLGLLQFCDLRKNLFSIEMLNLLERLAGKLAIAVKERWDVEALQQSERNFRALFENAPVGIFTTTSSGEVITANPEMARIVGYDHTRDALAHFTELSRQLYADPERRADFLNALTTHGQVKGFEYEAISRTGKRMWLRMDARMGSTLPDGSYTIEGFSIDITRRKRIEQLLEARIRLSEYADTHSVHEVLQQTLDEAEILTSSRIGFFHFVEEDQKTIHFQMWSSATLQGTCTTDGLQRHYAVKKAGVWADCLRTRQPVVHNDYRSLTHRKGLPPGHPPIEREMIIPVIRDEKVVAILGMGNKPTEYTRDDIDVASELVNMAWEIVVRRNAQNDLLESRRALQTLVGNLPGVAFRCTNDARWTMHYIGGSCRELTGYDPDTFIGNRKLAFVDIIHPDDRQRVDDTIQTALPATGQYEIEYRIVDARGKVKWVWERGQAVEDTHSQTPLLEGFITDITERRQWENELRWLASAIEQAAESIVITDPDGNIVFINPSFERVTGYSRREVVGKNPRLLNSGTHDRQYYRKMWQTLCAGQTWSGSFTNRRKNGSLYIEKGTISPVFNAEGTITNFVAVRNDVTDELRLEEKLSQAQKMEAIGTLAGGIAHDFNNILFPMVGYAEMLQEDLPDGSQQQEYAADILSAALRARDLVQQILAFSRQSRRERYPLKIQQVMKEAVKLTRASLPSDISVTVDIDKTCPPVMADPTQIHQIIMNLITNAYHAMEVGGGVLSLSLQTVSIDAGASGDPALPAGTYVCIRVADTGEGIDPDIRDRIFEPYFTTKEEGKGTGLGLSVIHGIVTAYGGDIRLESENGGGTVFMVYLPVAGAALQRDVPREVIDIPGGSERMLLVDDEAPIVSMVKKMLDRLGYSVTTRTSSLEALEAFKADPGRFDLVVTDMTMPGMTGDQFAFEIKRIRPDIPVILCTGFSNRIDETRAAEIGIQGFVRKPILRQDIAETIRRVLDNRSSVDSAQPAAIAE